MEKIRFTPLYLQVKEAIYERVLAGEWPPGTFLPNEFALAEEYGVSQGTLRKALEELTLEKQLIRYQGKGTTVADFNKSNSVFPFYLIFDHEGQRIFSHARTLSKDTIPVPTHVAKHLELDAHDEVVFINRLRPVNEESTKIVLREHIFIPKKFFIEKGLEPSEVLPDRLYSYYITKFGKRVAHATEDMSTTIADELDVKYLEVAQNTTLLMVQRTSYTTNQEPLEYRICRIDPLQYNYRVIIT